MGGRVALAGSPHLGNLTALLLHYNNLGDEAVASLAESDFFDPRLFGVTAIICVLAWSVAQMATTIRMRQLYFEPDGDR